MVYGAVYVIDGRDPPTIGFYAKFAILESMAKADLCGWLFLL